MSFRFCLVIVMLVLVKLRMTSRPSKPFSMNLSAYIKGRFISEKEFINSVLLYFKYILIVSKIELFIMIIFLFLITSDIVNFLTLGNVFYYYLCRHILKFYSYLFSLYYSFELNHYYLYPLFLLFEHLNQYM